MRAQSEVSTDQKDRLLIQTTFMTGKSVANYHTFPATSLRLLCSIDIGLKAMKTTKSYTSFYNHPLYGISLSVAKPGNDSVLGREISISPFFEYNPFHNGDKGVYFRIGIGFSYFTRFYHEVSNPSNEAIGSSFTWAFHGIISRQIIAFSQTSLNLNLAYFHASNGHTQLPNFGLNAAMVGFSFRFLSGQDVQYKTSAGDISPGPKRSYFIFFRQGSGMNELGGTTGPVGGKKGFIYSAAVAGGIIFNRHIKVRTGFTYRYYSLVSSYNSETNPWTYTSSSAWFASNIFFFAGCEFLIGHFGLDIEGGINLYKPFYPYFFKTFENGSDLSYNLKKVFPTRMGLNYYVINTENNPVNNLSIGAHINANFGEADFSEISIAYTHILKRSR